RVQGSRPSDRADRQGVNQTPMMMAGAKANSAQRPRDENARASAWERRHPCRRFAVLFASFSYLTQLAGRDAGAPRAARKRALLRGQSVLTLARPAFTGFSSM